MIAETYALGTRMVMRRMTCAGLQLQRHRYFVSECIANKAGRREVTNSEEALCHTSGYQLDVPVLCCAAFGFTVAMMFVAQRDE
jgi:hypothetical protein